MDNGEQVKEIGIDVVIMTYNSAKYLNECLESIKNFIPYDQIIVIDHYSTDGTLYIAKKHRAKIILENVYLGYARQPSIENVSTEYFVFVDSDVVIKGNKWLEKACDYLYAFNDSAAVVLDVPSSNLELLFLLKN